MSHSPRKKMLRIEGCGVTPYPPDFQQVTFCVLHLRVPLVYPLGFQAFRHLPDNLPAYSSFFLKLF